MAFLYPILSFVSQLLVGSLLGLALVPSFLFLQWVLILMGGSVTGIWPAVAFCLALGLAFILFGNSLLLLIVLIRNVFRIHNTERRGHVYSPAAIGHALFNLLLHVGSLCYLQFIKSSYFNASFYRGMGAKIGRGTIVATHRIWDCDLVEIGENCIIGGNSSISAHYAAGERGRLRRVRIGNSVTIGANASIMPGVVIEDHVVVGANSVVTLGKRLKAGGIYLGVPAVRIN